MAATTFRGITYTTSGGGVEVDYDMPMWAGVDPDDSGWLTGYPGGLTSFAARQTDGTNKMQPRLVRVHWSTAGNDDTLTLSPATATAEEKPAPVSEILFAMVQWQESNAAPGLSQHVDTGINVDEASHFLVATDPAQCDVDGGETISDHFSVGDYVLNAEGAILGKLLESTGSTSLTLEASTTVQVNDDAAFHKRTPLILTNTSGTTESMALLLLVA